MLPAVVVVVLEQHRLEADRLGELEQRRLPSPLSSQSSSRASSGCSVEALFLDDDRETEVDGQHDASQRPVVLGDEVVERGHHAVARAALGDRVVMVGFRPPPGSNRFLSGRMPRLRVRLAELLGDALRRVVQVAPAVRPTHVVHDEDRERRARIPGGRGEHLELVVDRVPVVVAVDERDVHGAGGAAARCG